MRWIVLYGYNQDYCSIAIKANPNKGLALVLVL